MTYRTILVCLNDVARLDVLLNPASDIAAKQNAHVIGLYVLPAVRVYPAVGLGSVAQVVEKYREMAPMPLVGRPSCRTPLWATCFQHHGAHGTTRSRR